MVDVVHNLIEDHKAQSDGGPVVDHVVSSSLEKSGARAYCLGVPTRILPSYDLEASPQVAGGVSAASAKFFLLSPLSQTAQHCEKSSKNVNLQIQVFSD